MGPHAPPMGPMGPPHGPHMGTPGPQPRGPGRMGPHIIIVLIILTFNFI